MLSRLVAGAVVSAAFVVGGFMIWVAIYSMLDDPDVPERAPIPIEIVRQRMADNLATATVEAEAEAAR